MARLLVIVLLAVPLLGQDAATVALLVNEPAVDAAQLAEHLASPDALTRATAARVALVRGVTDTLPALREVVATEANAEAAREQVRALARGGEPASRPEWLAWLRTVEGRARVPGGKPVLRHLSLEEQHALEQAGPSPAPGFTYGAPFRLHPSLPSGLGAQLLAATRCDSGWFGTTGATVDRAGRARAVDLARVYTMGGCRKALEAMLRLSLAEPSGIDPPLTAEAIQLARAEGEVCFDEAAPDAYPPGPYRIGGEVKAPVITRRVNPPLPESLMGGPVQEVVVVEAVITKTGCIRAASVLKGASRQELNGVALEAVAKWKFEPATLDGRPVDVIDHFSIHFNR